MGYRGTDWGLGDEGCHRGHGEHHRLGCRVGDQQAGIQGSEVVGDHTAGFAGKVGRDRVGACHRELAHAA